MSIDPERFRTPDLPKIAGDILAFTLLEATGRHPARNFQIQMEQLIRAASGDIDKGERYFGDGYAMLAHSSVRLQHMLNGLRAIVQKKPLHTEERAALGLAREVVGHLSAMYNDTADVLANLQYRTSIVAMHQRSRDTAENFRNAAQRAQTGLTALFAALQRGLDGPAAALNH